jgi:hypothetical protein|tara:strand:- start:814 stop:1065 length:252 start_codon:yes stop_codon:yes gene_type:complete
MQMKKWLNNIMASDKPVPQSYRPVMEAQEIVDVFSRTTLHQQAALLRLISRNLVANIDGQEIHGLDLDYEVEGAIIKATESLD